MAWRVRTKFTREILFRISDVIAERREAASVKFEAYDYARGRFIHASSLSNLPIKRAF